MRWLVRVEQNGMGVPMNLKKIILWLAGLGLLGVAGTFAIGSNPIMIGAAFMNLFFSAGNPAAKIEVEVRQPATASNVTTPVPTGSALTEWASYNRTITSDRYSPLAQINADNAANLKVICTYDTKRLEGSQTGLLMIEGLLIGTTAEDIFALDPLTCEEKWRIEEKSGIGLMPVNRGPAYLDGKLFRVFPDGFMRAYELKTGKKLWETYLGQKDKKMWFNAAPVAWNGMIFWGNSGGDLHNIRGRVFGIDANTGKALWQIFTVPKQADDELLAPEGKMPTEEMQATWGNPPDVPISGGGTWTSYTLDPETGYLYIPVGNPAPDFVKSLRPGSNLMTNTMLIVDAKTGNYVKRYDIMKDDWHDWDMSNPPTLYTSRAGRKLLSFHPKDGHLYTYDRATDKQLYRNPVTKQLNTDVPFEPYKPVYFCPGSVGGGEWNSAAYDPKFNLVFTGENEWCTTAEIKPDDKAARNVPDGFVWFGVTYISPYKMAGMQDPVEKWGGWVYASDADTGEWRWRVRTNYPILGAVTPTAGGIVAFGDMGGNFRIMRASNGEVLFGQHFEGAFAGGLITYSINGTQRIAAMSGVNHPQWPVKPTTGKILVFGVK